MINQNGNMKIESMMSKKSLQKSWKLKVESSQKTEVESYHILEKFSISAISPFFNGKQINFANGKNHMCERKENTSKTLAVILL